MLRSRLLIALALLGLSVGSSRAAGILIYDSNSVNHRAQAAATSLGLTFTVGNSANFNTLLTSGTWDLVIVDAPSTIPTGGWNSLINYINSNGRAIMSFWDLDNDSGQGNAALPGSFNVSVSSSFNTPVNVTPWVPGHPIFNTPNTVGGISSWSDLWADDGDRLNVLAGGTALAGFTGAPSAGNAAIVLGNNGRTFYNGFLFDEANNPNGTNLLANEIRFLLNVPEPASMALFGGLVALGGLVARRRMAKVTA